MFDKHRFQVIAWALKVGLPRWQGHIVSSKEEAARKSCRRLLWPTEE